MELPIEQRLKMLSRGTNARALVQRHRGKILTSVGILATLFTAGSVCVYLVKRWLYQQQLKITEQHFIREQIRRRFTQTQEDTLYALYELIPVFAMVLAKKLDLEELLIALRDKKLSKATGDRGKLPENDALSSGISTTVTEVENSSTSLAPKVQEKIQKTKAELWNELKTKSLVKMVTVSYTISSLLLLTRLQLNILTRREYLETAIKVAVEKESGKTEGKSLANWVWGLWKSDVNGDGTRAEPLVEETKPKNPASKNSYINEQAFLSLSWWLLNRGWLEFQTIVEESVNKEFSELNPRDTLTLKEFSDKLTHVFRHTNEKLLLSSVTGADEDSILRNILLPSPSLEDFVLQQTLDPEALNILGEDRTILGQLIHETTKCIESTVSSIVLESLINESFQYIMEQVETSVGKKKSSKTEEAQPSEEPSDKKYQVAVYAISCKDCCNEILKSGVVSMDNEFLARLDSVVILDDLSASVYSNFGFQD